MPGALTIRKLHMTVLAPPDHPEPEGFRIRLEDTLRASFSAALAEAIGDWPDEGILRIHRIEIDLTAGSGVSSERLTAQLARAVADALARARGDGERVLAFADRSHYLAVFLQELAAGRAWQRWWFKSFDGLRMLAPSAAIRTALLADATTGLTALMVLPPGALASVLVRLSEADAVRVLDGFARLPDAGARPERVVAALVAARATPAASALLGATPAAALALYLDVLRVDRDCGGARPAALATTVAALDRLMTGHSSAVPIEVGRILQSTHGANAADAAALAAVAVLPPDLRDMLFATTRQEEAASRAAARRYTPFGGLFILLASLDLARIEEVIEASGAPSVSADPSPARLIGLLTLAACAGRTRAAQVPADPIWRELFNIPPSWTAFHVAAELARLPKQVWLALSSIGETITTRADARFLLLPPALVGGQEAAHAIAKLARGVLSRFARRLPGFAHSSAPFLWHNLLAVSAAVDASEAGLAVLLDRCALDVLLSISGIADASMSGPGGTWIQLRRRLQ
jgi:hypothetical protein